MIYLFIINHRINEVERHLCIQSCPTSHSSRDTQRWVPQSMSRWHLKISKETQQHLWATSPTQRRSVIWLLLFNLAANQHHPAADVVSWNVFGSMQRCSATTKTSVCYRHCFSPRVKIQHHTRHCEEKISVPAEIKTRLKQRSYSIASPSHCPPLPRHPPHSAADSHFP